jgi:hypothetical protein
MQNTFEGFLSCVCVAHDQNDLEKISNFSSFLVTVQQNFEMIVCVFQNSIDTNLIEEYCSRSTNIAIYEVSASGLDAMFTAGLELALGDWILELPFADTLKEDAQEIFNLSASDLERKVDSYQLTQLKWNPVDWVLSFLSSVALEVPVNTMIYMPRLTKRTVLETWNSRKLRTKVLRVAPQLGRGIVLTRQSSTKRVATSKRLFRVGIRTLAHSSAKPLRWVSFVALIGAFISIAISIGILFVGISRKVVPGWTTTNLQISGLSFLILLVLGMLTEYIYQIAAASIDQPTFRVIRDFISPHYVFKVENNVSRSQNIEKAAY